MIDLIVVSAFVVLVACAAALRFARMGQARDEAVEDANKLSE